MQLGLHSGFSVCAVDVDSAEAHSDVPDVLTHTPSVSQHRYKS
jgi:hypothetical protein